MQKQHKQRGLGTDKLTLELKTQYYDQLLSEGGRALAWRRAMSELIAIVMWLISRFGGRETYNLMQEIADRVADNEVIKGQNDAP